MKTARQGPFPDFRAVPTHAPAHDEAQRHYELHVHVRWQATDIVVAPDLMRLAGLAARRLDHRNVQARMQAVSVVAGSSAS
jgi:hypothetical protein